MNVETQTEEPNWEGQSPHEVYMISGESDTSSEESITESSEHVEESVLNDLHEIILIEIDEYVKSNISQYHKPLFHSDLIEFVTDSTCDGLILSGDIHEPSDANREAIYELVSDLAHQFFYIIAILPVRSFSQCTPLEQIYRVTKYSLSKEEINAKIETIRQHILPDQRSDEWYKARYNMLTASNIYKALGSEAQYNSLVCEKCKPIQESSSTESAYINTQLSTHWGQKYEPISVMIYELLYPGNKVDTTFGCIPHPIHSFLGASPDGIIIKGTRIGHMLEIKNSVSRELNGIPSLAYWVQTQLQMEVCDLEFCDLFETSFKEFKDENEFYHESELYDFKGVILYFVDRNITGVPIYEYMAPIKADLEEQGARIIVETWKDETIRRATSSGKILVEVQWWYLELASCVVIPRNREWFQSVLPTFTTLWETIEKERISGWTHRMPVKSKPKKILEKTDASNTDISKGLVIKLDY